MNTIGPKIRYFREENNWTQDELAAHCHLVGWEISRGTIAKIESQVRRITDNEVELIAKVLNISVQQLFDE